jgi:hypothetical protein
MINLLVHGLPHLEGVDSLGLVAAWGWQCSLSKETAGGQRPDCGTSADFVMPPLCPAMALPSINKVGHVRPYLLAAHRQLVVGDSPPYGGNWKS